MDRGDGARPSETEDNDIVATEDIPRFGVPRNGPDLSDRVSQLERHMRRIAIELEAAGAVISEPRSACACMCHTPIQEGRVDAGLNSYAKGVVIYRAHKLE